MSIFIFQQSFVSMIINEGCPLLDNHVEFMKRKGTSATLELDKHKACSSPIGNIRDLYWILS